MSKFIREFKFFSWKKKALSVLVLVAVGSLAVLLTAYAQPLAKGAGETVNPNVALVASQAHYDTTDRGRAPEPSTMVLMGSGFLAALVRFARRRFAEFKRGFDIVVSILSLIITLPVLLAAMAFIKLTSPGPVFYLQKRVGKDGLIFDMLKLRTMVADAEKDTGPVWAAQNDPRVTPVGRFLRKSRIDEIPQLVNVLAGHMSIIGPRPERPEFVGKLSGEIGDYNKRLDVRPGITGLAQIRQDYDTTLRDVRRKVKFDLLYIKRMCFLTDLRIVLSTVVVVLMGKGAR